MFERVNYNCEYRTDDGKCTLEGGECIIGRDMPAYGGGDSYKVISKNTCPIYIKEETSGTTEQ